MPNLSLLNALAQSFLAGEQTVEQVVARGTRTLGKRWRWLRPLAQRYVEIFANGRRPRPRRRDVVVFLLHDRGFAQIQSKYFHELFWQHLLTEPQQMQPVAAAKMWNVPAIESVGTLAEWLRLTPSELQWFADLKGLGYRKSSQQLRHYHYRVLVKRSGNIRLIEAPKPRLKELQRQILSGILEKVPPHPAAQGFLKGRSIKTFVAPHVGQRVVLRMDLRDFFPTFCGARVQTLFRTVGYPESVADLLGGICTNAAPRDAWNDPGFRIDPIQLHAARALYARPHLPQGAPTSPAIANLCSYRVDCRLTGLAKSAGAAYTRYADDIAFSGGEAFERCVERFSTHVAVILHEEGFSVHHRKTRIMRQGVRQHMAGLASNPRAHVTRAHVSPLSATRIRSLHPAPPSHN